MWTQNRNRQCVHLFVVFKVDGFNVLSYKISKALGLIKVVIKIDTTVLHSC